MCHLVRELCASSSVQGEKRRDKERERENEVVKKKETQQKKSNPIIVSQYNLHIDSIIIIFLQHESKMIFNIFIACIVGIFTLSLFWQPEGLSKVVKVKIPSDYRKLVKHAEGKTPPPGTHITLSSLYF